jgi:hypothetical protein
VAVNARSCAQFDASQNEKKKKKKKNTHTKQQQQLCSRIPPRAASDLLLIDDHTPSRLDRRSLLDPAMRFVGVAEAPHVRTRGQAWVALLAAGYEDAAADAVDVGWGKLAGLREAQDHEYEIDNEGADV